MPNEVNDVIDEEMRRKGGSNQESFVYGSSTTGDAEGLLFPDLTKEGAEGQKESADSDSSWFFW